MEILLKDLKSSFFLMSCL
ncbi:hypothetical protein M8C21_007203 [Ambrosia artemisiifolia]|uniref:Uncharacterized protein n=1 Tax=Ambrosia artemisiifolia TaxID=4212 RepID=A0AAD5GFW7_AMBAR|nr:hypothetical protein M8C21_007203 [Ambrosia artemisiifolia]